MKDKSNLKLIVVPLVGLIIGLSIFIVIKSNKKTVETNQIEYPFAFENISIDPQFNTNISEQIQNINFSIYEINSENQFFPSNILAQNISQQLDLTQVGENKWEDDDYIISYLPNSFYIRIDISHGDSEQTDLSEELIRITSENKLRELSLWTFDEKEVSFKIDILEGGNLSDTAATISISEILDNKDVYTDLSSNAEIYLQLNNSGEIIQIRYFYAPYVQVDKEVQSGDLIEIENALSIGRFKILEGEIEPDEGIRINLVKPIYFVSIASTYLQPVYVIEAVSDSNEDLTLLVPALKEAHYSVN